jgi:hypothetical protein
VKCSFDPAHTGVDPHGEKNDQPGHERLPRRIDLQQIHTIERKRQDQGTDQRAGHVPNRPNKDAPPIGTAAMAGKVNSSPLSPYAELMRARIISEARPAMAPLRPARAAAKRLDLPQAFTPIAA